MGKKGYRQKEIMYKINNMAMLSLLITSWLVMSLCSIKKGEIDKVYYIMMIASICIFKLMLIGLRNNITYHIEEKYKNVKDKLGKVKYKGNPENIGYYLSKIVGVLVDFFVLTFILLFLLTIFEGYKYKIIEMILNIILLVATILHFILRKYKFKDYRNTIYENGVISSNGDVLLFNDAESMVVEDSIIEGSKLKILGNEYFSGNEMIITVFIKNKHFDDIVNMFEGMCKYELDE